MQWICRLPGAPGSVFCQWGITWGITWMLAFGVAPAVAAAAVVDECQILRHSAAGADACYSRVFREATDAATRAEAAWAINQVQQANREFQVAVRQDPANVDLRVRWGELYLSTRQYADAESLFAEALAQAPGRAGALTGLARVALDGFEARARGLVEQALAVDREYAAALLVEARLALEGADGVRAREILLPLTDESAPRLVRLDAMALLAAADHLAYGEAPQWTVTALELAPAFGDIYAVPAHFYIITRRYREAVGLLEQAVAIDTDNHAARAELGINLLRVNRFVDARRELESVFSAHPYDSEVVNTLRLLDSLASFDTFEDKRAVLRIHPSESAVLKPYILSAIERASQEMAARYDHKLERPVVVELFQRHDDFAVRTAGLPGIGILGAAFGDVVVMDGPSAQPAERFDWASALWHELAHVYTLNATSNRIARWFSEGISMLEEWRYGPSQRTSVSLNFVEAYADGKLLPIADIEDGFIRPSYAGQIEVSYVQSGLVCLFISSEFPGGIVKMLREYKAGADTRGAIERGLSISAEALDEQFADFLDRQFGALVEDLEGYHRVRLDTVDALERGAWPDARDRAAEAVSRYPGYVGDGSPYLQLALAEKKLGDETAAFAALARYWRAGGRSPAALDELASLAARVDEDVTLLEVYTDLARLEPLSIERHIALGDLAAGKGQYALALPAYQSVLALKPYDAATAHFKVADTLYRLRRVEDARMALLQALEIAPRFKPALALLLEMN